MSFFKILKLLCSSQFSLVLFLPSAHLVFPNYLLIKKRKRKDGKFSKNVRGNGKCKKIFLIFRFFSISIDVVLMSLLLNLGNLISSVHLLFTLIMRSCLLAFQKYILRKVTVSRNLIFGSWISSKVN